jgi:hypothetical protein
LSAAPSQAPILVLGSGQRCGSTLVQRLLTSHPEVLIWGEHGGHLRKLLEMTDVLQRWDEGVSAQDRAGFEERGHQSWMANVLPGPEPVRDAARAWLLTFFGAPAAARGRPRWGFKEVRFGMADAAAIRLLFPDTVVVHITRDPRDVLVSLDWWERGGDAWPREYTQNAVNDWVAVNESVLHDGASADWVLSVRYEDVVAEPRAFTESVARLTRTDVSDFDQSVFEVPIHSNENKKRKLRGWSKLPGDLRALLDDERVRAVASSYGYGL